MFDGSVTMACASAGVCRATFYNHKRASAEFRALLERARDAAVDALLCEARQRALHASDRLLMFLLRSLDP